MTATAGGGGALSVAEFYKTAAIHLKQRAPRLEQLHLDGGYTLNSEQPVSVDGFMSPPPPPCTPTFTALSPRHSRRDDRAQSATLRGHRGAQAGRHQSARDSTAGLLVYEQRGARHIEFVDILALAK